MANRFLQKYNNLFREAPSLHQYYSKSYIIVESIWMASPFQIHGFSVNKAGKLLQHKINTVEHLNLVIGACKKNQALKRT